MIVHALHKQQNSPPRPIAAAKYLRAAGCYSSTHFSTEDNQIKPPPSFLLTVIAKKIQSTRNFCTFSFSFFPTPCFFILFLILALFQYFATHITHPVGVFFLFQVTPSGRTDACHLGGNPDGEGAGRAVARVGCGEANETCK